MTELARLQKDFQSLVLDKSTDFTQQVLGDDTSFIKSRTAIYQTAYRGRLAEVLMADFPALHTLMGDKQFERLCIDYISAHPSAHFSVRYFGQFLVRFLNKKSPYAQRKILAEMAGFEWLVGEVLDAETANIVTLEFLQTIAAAHWPKLIIKLHPSYRTLKLNWNLASFWRDVKNDLQADKLQNPEPLSTTVDWILWRKGIEVYYRSVSEPEAWLLSAVNDELTFAELCAGYCQWAAPDEVAAQIVQFLQNWLSDEMISEVRFIEE